MKGSEKSWRSERRLCHAGRERTSRRCVASAHMSLLAVLIRTTRSPASFVEITFLTKWSSRAPRPAVPATPVVLPLKRALRGVGSAFIGVARYLEWQWRKPVVGSPPASTHRPACWY